MNTPCKWYKIYIHGLFNPRPAQVAAHPGRWVLGWTYPSRGLPGTWKCLCKCTHWSTGSRHRCHCGARNACKISERILKDSCPITAPVIAGLINNSFQQSISFLTHGNWRKASQYQKIENPAAVPANNRPISLLPILSKVIERLAQKQFSDFFTRNNKLSVHQSSYKWHNSTETALVYVNDQLLKAIEEKLYHC